MPESDAMSMDISDLEDLQKDMEQAVRKLPEIAERRMGRATLIVERQAKINATNYPKVRTGRLRADIQPEVKALGGEIVGMVGNTVFYAPYQELGTRYMEPREYLQRALEDKEEDVLKELDGVLEEVQTMIETGGESWL
jgi:HK97 gp10 family phage protein